MKTNLQIAFGIVVLMGIVVLAAYLTQNTVSTAITTKNEEKIPPHTVPMLIFNREIADWRPEIFPLDPEQDRLKFIHAVELGSKNNYIFWARNPQTAPVEMLRKAASCTCADLEYALFSPAAWSEWQRTEALSATIHGLGGPDALGPLAVTNLLGSVTWAKLPGIDDKRPYPLVTPTEPAMLRVSFQPKKPSEQNGDSLMVTIRGQQPTGVNDDKQLMVKYETVPSLGFFPPVLDVGEMGGDGKVDAMLLVWTVTRETFD